MSYQPMSIIDPADTPTVVDPPPVNQSFRFRNFLVPLGIYDITNTAFQAQDLFCAGQTWSPFGDLIVAGGTGFDAASTPLFDGAVVTMVMNPRLPSADYPGVTASLYPGFDGMWKRGDDLEDARWYPTTTLTNRLLRLANTTYPSGREVVVVAGGSNDDGSNLPQDNPTWNTYEALVINQEATPTNVGYEKDFIGSPPVYTWDGPGTDTDYRVDWLYEYPRLHLLSNGRLFFSGYPPRAATVDHDAGPGSWTKTPGQPGKKYSSVWTALRHDAPSLLFPNLGGGTPDIVYRLGGCDEHWYDPPGGVPGSPNGTTATMESIHAAVPGATWQAAASMPSTNGTNGGRFLCNAVITPTGSILVFGGLHRAQNTAGGVLTNFTPVFNVQMFENGNWTTLSANPVVVGPNLPLPIRDYHSTAVLLPDGRVFVGGGNIRNYDYEIYSPPYLSLARPQNVAFNPTPVFDPFMGAHVLNYGATYTIQCNNLGPEGLSLAKAVLMSPGAMTHHSDMHARYFELSAEESSVTSSYITFVAPNNDREVPRGIYMLFLVTDEGGISEATWVVLR
ncbi:MAG: DUF1929 domain-containing protein [Planctomycetes bacterium]|nr:DUF1929 domain-containing protein [Planctomycetota bacterium]